MLYLKYKICAKVLIVIAQIINENPVQLKWNNVI